MTKKKIYRTVIQFEILSEEPISDSLSLSEIYNETTDGNWSGIFLENTVTNEILQGKKAIKAIKNQGSDPLFFSMNNNGN